MTVTHVGTTKKYVAGWETIFGGSGKKQGRGAAMSAKKGAASQGDIGKKGANKKGATPKAATKQLARPAKKAARKKAKSR